MPSKKELPKFGTSRRNKASRAKAPKPLLTGPEPGGIASNAKFAIGSNHQRSDPYSQ
jgi:hypothetical protein